MANVRTLESRFADAVGNLGAELGLNRVVAQIYAYLFLSEERRSLEAVAKALHVSKATISTNVRELERWGAVRRVWVDGSRKGYYVANRDTLGIVLSAVIEGLGRRLDRLEESLQEVVSEGAARRQVEEQGRVRDRVAEVQAMVLTCRRALDAVENPTPRSLAGLLPLLKRGIGGRRSGGTGSRGGGG